MIVTACIGIGSNVGDREGNCTTAAQALRDAPGIYRVKTSSLYLTEPAGYLEQAEFVNCAVMLETELSPPALLALCKEIEQRLGRQDTFRWGPRVIDLDIILYGAAVVTEPDLVIPHPLMHKRRFVLYPLAEIAPDAIDPVTGATVRRLLAECMDTSQVKPVSSPR